MNAVRQLNPYNTGIDGPAVGFRNCDGTWFDQGKHDSYRKLAAALVAKFNPKTVLELGSGAGSLAWHLRDLDHDLCVVTVEGNPESAQSPFILPERHVTARTDLPMILCHAGELMEFDLVISFEHFEHIPPETFGTVLENIHIHTSPGARLVASACVYAYDEPDGTEMHPNVKSWLGWMKYLSANGFKPLKEAVIAGNEPWNLIPGHFSELVCGVPAKGKSRSHLINSRIKSLYF